MRNLTSMDYKPSLHAPDERLEIAQASWVHSLTRGSVYLRSQISSHYIHNFRQFLLKDLEQ